MSNETMSNEMDALSQIKPLLRKMNLPENFIETALARAGGRPDLLRDQLARLVKIFELDLLEQNLVLAFLFDWLTAGGLGLALSSLERNSLALAEIFKVSENRVLQGCSPLTERALVALLPAPRLQPEIISFLLGSSALPENLRRYLDQPANSKSYSVWLDSQGLALQRALSLSQSISLVYSNDCAQDILELQRAARQIGRKIFVADLNRAVEESGYQGVGDLFKRLANAVALANGTVVLICDAALPGALLTQQLAFLSELKQVPVAILLTDTEAPLKRAINRSYFEFTSPTKANLSGKIWRLEAAERKLDIPEDMLRSLESVFPFSLSKIERVFDQLVLEKTSSKFDYLTIAALCRRQSSRVLDQLARRIEPKYGWESLMLPSATKLKLSEVYHYIAGRSQMDKDWKLRQKHNRGHGVTIVLKGVSGTGKTMAAEVLARELGLDLYQVDLASLTSKYVGETEKNLSRIFQAARETSGILLFDEGEVLFSHRTEITSGQDKYANLEVNYLLQELETFDGIVIISTNQARAIDTAFLRRVTFDIEIPRPDEATRKEIWKTHLSGGLPLSVDVDFDFLAKLRLPGGLIRNIVKQAASIASQHGDELKMADILHSVKREFTKIGEPLERDFFGEKYWPIVSADWEAIYASKESKSLLEKPAGRRFKTKPRPEGAASIDEIRVK